MSPSEHIIKAITSGAGQLGRIRSLLAAEGLALSYDETGRLLQQLRDAGKIRYVKVNAGGRGWEVVR